MWVWVAVGRQVLQAVGRKDLPTWASRRGRPPAAGRGRGSGPSDYRRGAARPRHGPPAAPRALRPAGWPSAAPSSLPCSRCSPRAARARARWPRADVRARVADEHPALAQVRHEDVGFSFFRMLSRAEALSFQRAGCRIECSADLPSCKRPSVSGSIARHVFASPPPQQRWQRAHVLVLGGNGSDAGGAPAAHAVLSGRVERFGASAEQQNLLAQLNLSLPERIGLHLECSADSAVA